MWSGLFHLHNATSSSMLQMSGLPLFLRLNNNPLCLYHIYATYIYIYPFFCQQTLRLFLTSCLRRVELHWTWDFSYLFELMILFPSDVSFRNGTAGSCCYIFNNLRTLHTVFHRACSSSHFPSSVSNGTLFSTPLSAFISCLFDNRRSNRCEVTSCGLICLSMIRSAIEHISSFTCRPFVHLLWKNICLSSLPV